MSEITPNGARRIFVPTDPDLPDIVGDTDFDFKSFHFGDLFGSQISRPGLGLAWAGPGLSLGRAWTGLGPGLWN